MLKLIYNINIVNSAKFCTITPLKLNIINIIDYPDTTKSD